MCLCLVTGGAGFIGSHTVDALLEAGYRVRVLDSCQRRVHPNGKPTWIPDHVHFIEGDVTNLRDLQYALEDVEFVFHLAAYQDYMPDFSTFIHTNTESAALLFECIVADNKRFPVKKIVFASSQSVSGEGKYVCAHCAGSSIPSISEQLRTPSLAYELPPHAVHRPLPRSITQLYNRDWELHCPVCRNVLYPLLIDEQTINPGTSYAISKYAIELLADRLGRRYNIATTCVRYTYVQGERNSFFNAYSGVMRRFALQLLQKQAPVVYEDGMQMRDYINVWDVARANVLVMEDERANFGVFNVGGGRSITVWEFAQLMVSAFGSTLEVRMPEEFRIGDTRHTISDISKLRALGWEPTIPVEQSIQEYVSWIHNQLISPGDLEQADLLMKKYAVVRSAGGH